MFEKIRYVLTLFDNKETLVILLGLGVYHAIVILSVTLFVRSSSMLKFRSLQAEQDEHKKNRENCDQGWNDRAEELRRNLSVEREREISQLKAEYDSYISLLEHKLAQAKMRENEPFLKIDS